MRTFGIVLVIIGVLVGVLGVKGKMPAAWSALLTGKVPQGSGDNGPTIPGTKLTENPATGSDSTGNGHLINPNGTTSLPNFFNPDPNAPGGISITPGL